MDYPPQAAPNPYYGQPHPQGMGMPMAMDQHSYSQPMPDPRYQQAALQISLEEERELEELRASVREIRDVVDHLVQTRSARRRFG